MVHVPTRGRRTRVPVRLGPSIHNVPDYGPSRMSRQPYTDPMQFELERERVLDTTGCSPAAPSRSPAPATG